jgi:hypothetical protein
MILEFLYSGFPVIHNGDTWKEFGYAYDGNNFMKAAELMKEAVNLHQDRFETYRAHGRILAWRHSVYNPLVQEGWKKLLDGGS